MKLLIIAAIILALVVVAQAFSTPNPATYQRLYFCADEQGHLTYIENSRQIDCPGRQEVLVWLGTEVKNP